MTVGEAMERAEELRPGSRVAARTRQRWLCEVDGMLREKFFRPSSADSREGVGADIAWDNGLRDDDVLLVPPPFDSLYPHYLCAMTDAALGENDRYAGEQYQPAQQLYPAQFHHIQRRGNALPRVHAQHGLPRLIPQGHFYRKSRGTVGHYGDKLHFPAISPCLPALCGFRLAGC